MRTPPEGPGLRRMRARLGPTRTEELRQQVLREQEAALIEAASGRPVVERDRCAYRDYPPVRRRK